jgi:1,4-dihydroxy-2-naphthoyl-CoA hydrolase
MGSPDKRDTVAHKDMPPQAAGSAPVRERANGERGLRDGERQHAGLGIDGVSAFMGMRWEDSQTVRLTIRPELINAGGLLSGVVTYALVDYCMGSTLWAQTSEMERIATINISINYIQTATEGEIVCRTQLDRRNRSNAVMHSEVRDEHDRLLVTAIGSYTIFVPKALRSQAEPGR